MANDMTFVFLSHASEDKPFARRLTDALEDHDMEVWLDERRIRVGQSIPQEVASAIDAADVLCVVISEASDRSNWVRREANAFLMQMLASTGVVLPCRLDDTPPPPLIGDVKYADFRSSFEEGLASLLQGAAIKEEIDRREQVADTASEVVRALNADELAFFVLHFTRPGGIPHYSVSDRREERIPTLLDRLVSIGVLDRADDRYEALWALTSLGRHVLEAVRVCVPESDLERLAALRPRWR